MGALLAAGRGRLERGGPRALLVRGTVLVAAVAVLAAGAAAVVRLIADSAGRAGLAVEALALAMLLSLRGLVTAARGVAAALARGDLAAARAAVGRDLVSRPTAGLDAAGVASAAIESVAENLTDSLVAPACFYLAFGLPGAALYRAVNTADAMLGYRQGTLEHFGKAAARLDDLLNLAPARVAGLAVVAAAACLGERARGALAVLRRDRRRPASPNAGWTMAAMAGALDLTLAKPGAYVLGSGRAPEARDIDRAIRVVRVAAVVALGGAAMLRAAAGGLG